MGLFDKKYCDICGEKIGFLGNRKLEDGNLCKDCARKLSPFFSERRNSTVEDIKRQLLTVRKTKRSLPVLLHRSPLTGAKRYTSILSESGSSLPGPPTGAAATPTSLHFPRCWGLTRISGRIRRRSFTRTPRETRRAMYRPAMPATMSSM